MKWIRSIGRLIDRILCTAAAILCMQIPIYMNQYLDTLAEARNRELPTYEENMRQALIFHQTYPEYFEKLRRRGFDRDSLSIVEHTFYNYQSHDSIFQALDKSPKWKKPIVFVQHYDANLALGVDFWPGIPPWRQALVYGIIGIVLCSLVLGLGGWLIGKVFPTSTSPESPSST